MRRRVKTLSPARGESLPAALRDRARTSGRAIAMRHKRFGVWSEFTWAEVYAKVEALAAWCLTEAGESRYVVLCGNNEPQLFWAVYGVQASGRASVCLHPDLGEAEVRAVLERLAPDVVVVEDQAQCDKLLAAAEGTTVRHVVFWDGRGIEAYDDPRLLSFDAIAKAGAAVVAARPSCVNDVIDGIGRDDAAIVVHTSGSTGEPRALLGSHGYLLDGARRWDDVLSVSAGGDYVSAVSAAWHVEQFLAVTLGVLAPMTVNLVEDPDSANKDVRELGAEYLALGARQWEAIADSVTTHITGRGRLSSAVIRHAMDALQDRPDARWDPRTLLAWLIVGRPLRDRLGLSRLRAAVMSGGALAPDVLALLHALRVPVVIGYEFAEAGLVAVTLPGSPLQPARVLTSAGSSAALEVRVRDNEIQVRGGCPVSGQVDGTDAARHTDDGWLRSGDAGRLSGDGELIFLDRLGSLLDDAGQPVPSDPLESRLRRCAHVADAVIVRADGCLQALVTIDGPAVRNWAEERGIAVTSFKQLSQHPHVLNLIADEIGNAELPAGFCIERFASLPKGFDADDGELTRTGVVRRPIVLERYAAVVDALRRSDAMVGVSVELRLTDGRLLSIEEDVVINQVRRSAPDRRGVA